MRPVLPAKAPDAVIEKALDSPIGSLPLQQAARGARQVVVLVDDMTRPTPTNLLLPPILRRLHEAGLPKSGITVFVTTAYLDEAERCNRVGLMHRGRLICCDTPDALRRPWAGAWYEVHASDPRAARMALQHVPGVLGVETAGASLHLFLTPERTSPEALRQTLEKGGFGGSSFRPIAPSLEDVFIARVREAEVVEDARG